MDAKLIKNFRKARIHILSNKKLAFFGGLVMAMRPHQDDDKVPTAGIDKHGNLYLNSKWFNALKPSERVAVLCHEILHPAFKFDERLGTRDTVLFNVAHDIWINEFLGAYGLDLPEGGINKAAAESKFGIQLPHDVVNDIITESIYDLLYDKAEKVTAYIQGGSDGLSGDALPSEDDGKGKQDGSGKENNGSGGGEPIDWDTMILSAAAAGEGIGSLPASIRARLGIVDPKVDWRTLIFQFFNRVTSGGKYSFRRPKRRHQYRGITLPSLVYDSVYIWFAYDTSGSMTVFQEAMLGELSGCQDVTGSKIRFLAGDTQLQYDETIEPGDAFPDELPGWGGTTFTWLFEHLYDEDEHDVAGIVFGTDGYNFDTIPEEYYPDVPCLWVIYDNKDFKAPFGEVVHVSRDDLQ